MLRQSTSEYARSLAAMRAHFRFPAAVSRARPRHAVKSPTKGFRQCNRQRRI